MPFNPTKSNRLVQSKIRLGKTRNLSWHTEARSMRAAGSSLSSIARHFGKSPNTVRYAVDPVDRIKVRNRIRRQRGWTEDMVNA